MRLFKKPERKTPILFDSHMHTPLCKHAIGDPEDYAEAGIRRNLRGVIFTCHNPVPNWGESVRMDLDQYQEYIELVERAKERMAGRTEVLLGLESDFAPGMEAYLEALHARVPLNYVLGSVHPQLGEYRARYFSGDALQYMRTYFTHIAEAAESKLFDCISHPDLIKNLFPRAWNVEAMLDDIRRCLDRVAKTGVCLELNTSGLQKSIEEMNPGPVMLREMGLRKIPVVIGSDSHMPRRVGEDFVLACDHLKEAGYSEVCFFIERKRQAVNLEMVRESLI